MEYIQRKIASVPQQYANDVRELGELFDKKLWHQLTVKLESLLRGSPLFKGSDAIELYNEFVRHFESKMSAIKLVKVVSFIGESVGDAAQAAQLFSGLLQGKTKLDDEARLCLELDIAHMNLLLGGDAAECDLSPFESALAAIKPSEPLVFSKLYQTQCLYKKIHGPANEFYSSALMYLAYTPVDEIEPQAARQLATDMALAAITSTKIYNFGEVLATPILDVLASTPQVWLKQVVEMLNQGAVLELQQLITTHREAFESSPLAHMIPVILQKAQLMAVVNLVFERSAHDRIIKFDEIAQRCHINAEQVEWLLMKAMSQSLIKGSIDEVAQTVSVTWIQPRVLNVQQLTGVMHQIAAWRDKTKNAAHVIEDQTTELFA